jgi:hypothetical protein
MFQTFIILSESTKQYRRFNAVDTQLTVWLAPPTDNSNPVRHFKDNVKEVFEYSLQNSCASDMVGITIYNEANQQDAGYETLQLSSLRSHPFCDVRKWKTGSDDGYRPREDDGL